MEFNIGFSRGKLPTLKFLLVVVTATSITIWFASTGVMVLLLLAKQFVFIKFFVPCLQILAHWNLVFLLPIQIPLHSVEITEFDYYDFLTKMS